MRNLITDIAGVRVGHAEDHKIGSGVTAILFDSPAIAAADLRGGAPGTRESALLDPAMTVERIDAIALSGGSAFGLDAASGVQAWLAEQGRGFEVRGTRVPIVPAAIVFDLLNGGDKNWGRYPPYRELGYEAVRAAAVNFSLGSVGAGLGSRTVNLRGGIGSASAKMSDGISVGALAVVNAAGSVTVGDSAQFWAAPFERDGEFGNLGFPAKMPNDALGFKLKGATGENTALIVVITDATLTKSQTRRLAIMAQDGLARAIYPVHTPVDGDIVFAASTGQQPLSNPVHGLAALGALAADTVARAIARGVYEASALRFPGTPPAWRDKFGNQN